MVLIEIGCTMTIFIIKRRSIRKRLSFSASLDRVLLRERNTDLKVKLTKTLVSRPVMSSLKSRSLIIHYLSDRVPIYSIQSGLRFKNHCAVSISICKPSVAKLFVSKTKPMMYWLMMRS